MHTSRCTHGNDVHREGAPLLPYLRAQVAVHRIALLPYTYLCRYNGQRYKAGAGCVCSAAHQCNCTACILCASAYCRGVLESLHASKYVCVRRDAMHGLAGRFGKQGAASPVMHDATNVEQPLAQHPPSRTTGEREAALARRPENTGAAGPVPGTMQASSSVVALLSSADSGARPETSPTTGYSTNPTNAAGQGNTRVYVIHDIAISIQPPLFPTSPT